MQRVAVIIGSSQETNRPVYTPSTLPASDRAAVGLALTRFGVPVDAYCLRPDETALRYALAAGVATASYLDDIAALDADVVLVGNSGADPWGDWLLALLAERRDGDMVVEVLDVEAGSDAMTVTRNLGRGGKEILSLRGPAVLGIAETAVQPLYVSRYRRQVAGVVPPLPKGRAVVDPLPAVSGAWQAVRPRVKAVSLEDRTAGSATARLQTLLGMGASADREDDRAQVIVADAATCARYLLRFLRHLGVLADAGPVPEADLRPESKSTPHRPQVRGPLPVPPGRGPRPLDGSGHGMARRPRPVTSALDPAAPARLENRSRGPRPVGQDAPLQIRGPRPVNIEMGRS